MYTTIIKKLIYKRETNRSLRLDFANNKKLLAVQGGLDYLSITETMRTTPPAATEATSNLPRVHLEVNS